MLRGDYGLNYIMLLQHHWYNIILYNYKV
jgi:hypothetical protein